MHDPVGFLGLLLLPVVCVEDKDFLVPFDFVVVGIIDIVGGENGPCFASFVPASLVPFRGICEYFSPFSGSGGVCFGWPVEEVPDQPIFAYSCIYMKKEKFKHLHKFIYVTCTWTIPYV